jgi:hypothetical protein
MALDALWAVLIPEVSGVSQVQAPICEGFTDTPAVLPEVSGVSSNDSAGVVTTMPGGANTPDTPPENVRYQLEPAWALGCTLDTPDTPEKINTGANAANDLLLGELLTGWNVTIPPGASLATIAKFRTASLVLDASIVAAGGSLALPGERTTPSEPTTTTAAQPDSQRLFRQRGPWLTGSEQSAVQAYHAHHFICHTCIAAGRGNRYSWRCAAGRALWNAYTGADDLQTEGGNHGQA